MFLCNQQTQLLLSECRHTSWGSNVHNTVYKFCGDLYLLWCCYSHFDYSLGVVISIQMLQSYALHFLLFQLQKKAIKIRYRESNVKARKEYLTVAASKAKPTEIIAKFADSVMNVTSPGPQLAQPLVPKLYGAERILKSIKTAWFTELRAAPAMEGLSVKHT